jgi:hypothetical protein
LDNGCLLWIIQWDFMIDFWSDRLVISFGRAIAVQRRDYWSQCGISDAPPGPLHAPIDG